MRVLIVYDSAIVRERLVSMLSELKDVEVIGQAGSPAEAIHEIKKLKPDAVILDIRLKGGNGIEVLENIKKDQPAIRVIMFTNFPFPQYRKKCMEAGADFFFDKSIEFEKMLEVVRKMVNGS